MKTEQEYGPLPGMESLDERRLRLAREQEEREKKLKEIEQKKNSKVSRLTTRDNKSSFITLQDNFGECPQIYCMKIAEICEIATDKAYAI